MIAAPREAYTRTLLAAVPEIVEGVVTAILVPRGRLRPVSVGGGALGPAHGVGPGRAACPVTRLAVFARQFAPYNPIQPVGPSTCPR